MAGTTKIVILTADAGGLGHSIADGLSAKPGSDLSRKQSDLQISLAKYGINDSELSCSIIHFCDLSGFPQVTLIVMPDLQPPIAACSAKEIVSSVIPENSVILIPVFRTSHFEDKEAMFGIEVGTATELTQAFLHGIPKPTSLKLFSESLACFVQMIRVLNIPSIIIGSNHDHQGVNKVGEFIANWAGLSFSNGGIYRREKEKSFSQEPWRALYG